MCFKIIAIGNGTDKHSDIGWSVDVWKARVQADQVVRRGQVWPRRPKIGSAWPLACSQPLLRKFQIYENSRIQYKSWTCRRIAGEKVLQEKRYCRRQKVLQGKMYCMREATSCRSRVSAWGDSQQTLPGIGRRCLCRALAFCDWCYLAGTWYAHFIGRRNTGVLRAADGWVEAPGKAQDFTIHCIGTLVKHKDGESG